VEAAITRVPLVEYGLKGSLRVNIVSSYVEASCSSSEVNEVKILSM
jgi:hypothetical protein